MMRKSFCAIGLLGVIIFLMNSNGFGQGYQVGMDDVPPIPSVTPTPQGQNMLLMEGSSHQYLLKPCYTVPSDRTARTIAASDIKNMIMFSQRFYRQQMSTYGYYNRYFRYEKDTDGVTPKVTVIDEAASMKGTVTATSSGTTFSDSLKDWTNVQIEVSDPWPSYVCLRPNTSSPSRRRIISKTASSLTVDSAFSPVPALGNSYYIYRLHSTSPVYASGTQSATTLQDASQTWPPQCYVGCQAVIRPNTSTEEIRPIIGNSATVLTLASPWSTAPVVGTEYMIIGLFDAAWYRGYPSHVFDEYGSWSRQVDKLSYYGYTPNQNYLAIANLVDLHCMNESGGIDAAYNAGLKFYSPDLGGVFLSNSFTLAMSGNGFPLLTDTRSYQGQNLQSLQPCEAGFSRIPIWRCSSASTRSITLNSAQWPPNLWAGYYCRIRGGLPDEQEQKIVSNTGTVLSFANDWTSPSTIDYFNIFTKEYRGTVTAQGTDNTLTDSNQCWSPFVIGCQIKLRPGGLNEKNKGIQDANQSALTISSTWNGQNPNIGDKYEIAPPFNMVFGLTGTTIEGKLMCQISSTYIGSYLHEMGHAFGLDHIFSNDIQQTNGNQDWDCVSGPLMGGGFRGIKGFIQNSDLSHYNTYMSPYEAAFLNYSRYFMPDPEEAYDDSGTTPTISFGSPDTVSQDAHRQLPITVNIASGACPIKFVTLINFNCSFSPYGVVGVVDNISSGQTSCQFSVTNYRIGQNTFLARAYDSIGRFSSYQKVIDISGDNNTPLPPFPRFVADKITAAANESICFDGKYTIPGRNTYLTDYQYRWSYNNGVTWSLFGDSNSISHQFTSSGIYKVRLNVKDDRGGSQGESISDPMVIRITPGPTSSGFKIKNAAGERIAVIDEAGNLFLKGTLETGQDSANMPNTGWRLKANATIKASAPEQTSLNPWVIPSLLIAGSLTTNTTPSTGTGDLLVVRSAQGILLAVIDSNGNLTIKKDLVEFSL